MVLVIILTVFRTAVYNCTLSLVQYLEVHVNLFFIFSSEQIGIRQSQIDKLYAGLRDLAVERRSKLDEALKLFMLNREVDDLEQWIAEREVVAGSHELGQDYDMCASGE